VPAARAAANALGDRGRSHDPLYKSRRTLHTGAGLLTERQRERLTGLFADDWHVEVEATWGIYQQMVAAYRGPDKETGKRMMQAVIDALSQSVPGVLTELITLSRTLKRRAADVLAFFDRSGTSNGPRRQSMAAWSTRAAQPLDSATSPITSRGHCSKPEDPDLNYTLDSDEPV
jgi:transposase